MMFYHMIPSFRLVGICLGLVISKTEEKWTSWTWLKALVFQPRPWKKTNGKVEIWEEQSPQPAEFDLKPLKNDEFYTTTVVLLPCLRGKNRRLHGQDVIWSTSWHPTESKLMGARTMTSSRASATTSSGEISLKIWKKGITIGQTD